MVETIHLYATVILACLLGILSAVVGWLLLTVISNQSRIAVLEVAISNVGTQLTEVKRHLDGIDNKLDAGIEKLHARISARLGAG